VDRAQAEAIYDAGREAVVEVLLAMSEQIAALTTRVEELERQVAKNSRNSSKPPSSDPPWAPKAQPKKPSGRKRGGQDGHEGRSRYLYLADRIEPVWPEQCGCCGRRLARRADCAPLVHQVAELPPVAVEMVEYQLNRVACDGCQSVTAASLPEGVSRSAFGPRLHALVGTLTTDARVSRRNVHTLLTQVFGCPLSLGAVDGMLERLGRSLAGPVAEAWDFVRSSPVTRVDETGWKIDGTNTWMWGAFTDDVGVMRMDPERSSDAAERTLGDYEGIVSCDRYAVYRPYRRQLCWAHLDRNLSELALFPDPTRSAAEQLKGCCRDVFAAWRDYADNHQDRKRLQRRIARLPPRVRALLEAAAANGRDKKARRVCRNLLRDFDDYWTFARVPGVEPTNNDAERGLRRAVITRKLSFGSRTTRGATTTERLLTAGETCRRQGRSLYEYLTAAASAAAHGEAAPSLLPA
jgi:transposase